MRLKSISELPFIARTENDVFSSETANVTSSERPKVEKSNSNVVCMPSVMLLNAFKSASEAIFRDVPAAKFSVEAPPSEVSIVAVLF